MTGRLKSGVPGHRAIVPATLRPGWERSPARGDRV